MLDGVALGEADEGVLSAVVQLCEGFAYTGEWLDGHAEDVHAEVDNLLYDVGWDLAKGHGDGVLDHGEGEGLGAVAGEGHGAEFDFVEAVAHGLLVGPWGEQLAVTVLCRVEMGLIVPQGVIGIDGQKFDMFQVIFGHPYGCF